jgi:hypothetical protein
MTLRVNYLVVHKIDIPLQEILVEALRETFQDLYAEPPDEELLGNTVMVRYSRMRSDSRAISGVTLNIELDGEEATHLAQNFSKELADAVEDGIEHVVKLLDPGLCQHHQKFVEEIFEIEMKLREALSLILIDTAGTNFYGLIPELALKVNTKEQPEESQMRAHSENELYFLLFSDYINLNVRRKPTLDQLLDLIGEAGDYEELRRRIAGTPVSNEFYADFLASLRARVDPIEKVRNCIAHNRTIPRKHLEDYNMAKGPLLTSIEDFLAAVAAGQAGPDSTVQAGTGATGSDMNGPAPAAVAVSEQEGVETLPPPENAGGE